jgi:hypothetical protein
MEAQSFQGRCVAGNMADSMAFSNYTLLLKNIVSNLICPRPGIFLG